MKQNDKVQIAKSRRQASMGVSIKKADGTIIDFGTISNKPVIGVIQKLLFEQRIKRYRRKYERKKA